MILPMIRLELRKNRLAAASAAAAFLVTLPVCRFVSSATGLELRLSLDAGLTAWVLLGVPLAAALIGASSGAAAASRDTLESEALLPASSARRAAASIAASILLAALFAAFVFATGAALGAPPSRFLSPGEKAWGSSFWENIAISQVLALATLDLLAGAWALSRLIGHGVAGGLLALLLTAATGAGLAVCFGLQMEHHEWGVVCLRSALLIAYAGAFAKIGAGLIAARWNERRTGPRTLAAALALMIVPIVLIWGRAAVELRMLDAKVALIGRPFASGGEGAVLKTVRGGVLSADGRGVRILVPEQRSGLTDILLNPFRTWIRGAWLDEKGVLWVERYVSPNTELWRIEGSKVESIRMTDHGSISEVAGVPLKHRYPGGKRLLVARAEDYFRRGDRASWLVGYKDIVATRRREAGAGRVACDGRCFEAEGRRWKLPGAEAGAELVFPHVIGGRRAYLVPVRIGENWSMALCRADGSTIIAWPDFYPPETLPDGTIFSLWKGKLRSIGPDGTIASPIALGPSLSPSRLMRIAEGKAWLVSAGRLTVVDSAGRPVRSRPLPQDIEDAIPLKDGFVVTTKRSAYFSDWAGALRRIENPR